MFLGSACLGDLAYCALGEFALRELALGGKESVALANGVIDR